MPFHLPPTVGGGGAAVVHYNQPFAGATVVTVNHNLGWAPDVNVQNTSGNTIVGLVVHSSLNSFTVTFNVALAGTVYYT